MTPRIWIYIGGVVVVVLAILAVVSFLSDPFGIKSWFQGREQDQQEQIASDGIARGLESQGNAEQVQRVETFHTQVVEVRDLTFQAINEARSAPDATDPLPAERADRLRAADRRLCAVYYGCEAAPPPAS